MLENGKERAKIKKNKGGFLIFKNWNPYQSIKGQLRVYIRAPEKGIKNQILNNTGIVLSENKDCLKEKEAYRQALISDLNNSFFHYNLGTSLHDLKRYEEAIIAYQKAIELDPNDADPYYNLGEVF